MENSFTYETENNGYLLETFEWNNTWFEKTELIDANRVMYIGDSISCCVRRLATLASDNQLLFDGFGTSKALDNPFFIDELRLYAKQQKNRKAILFNNGLHGWHLDDTQYEFHYRNMIKFLKTEFSNIPVVIVLTTAIKDPERLIRVCRRNDIVRNIANEFNCPVIDLFSVSQNNPNLLGDDGVHFTDKGNEYLANEIVLGLKQII